MELFLYTPAVLRRIVKQVSWFHVKLAVTGRPKLLSSRLIFKFPLEKKQLHSEEKAAFVT
jgi:hypothetical protein